MDGERRRGRRSDVINVFAATTLKVQPRVPSGAVGALDSYEGVARVRSEVIVLASRERSRIDGTER
jgi:hypothetical protein